MDVMWIMLIVLSLHLTESASIHSSINPTNRSEAPPSQDEVDHRQSKFGPHGYIGYPKEEQTFLLNNVTCVLSPIESHIHERVAEIMKWDSKMIEFDFSIQGYSYNPLAENNTNTYKSNIWSRVVSGNGMTILNLAFNYGILSLMTLTFGVEKIDIELTENTKGCLRSLNEDDKINSVLDIMLRDLKANGSYSVHEDQGNVCHQVITEENGFAKFTDRCCYRRLDDQGISCYVDIPNWWLETLDILLACLMVTVFILGPCIVPDWLYSDNMRNVEYSVVLKEQLYKKVVVCRCDVGDIIPDDIKAVKAKHTLDLRNKRDFIKCKRLLTELPENKIIPIKLERFDIHVNYTKLQLENKVPVGMIQSISRSIFLCKLRNLEPFADCCQANMLGECDRQPDRPKPWIRCCKLLGRILLVLVLPFPFYIRLILYYIFEHPEIEDRQEAAGYLGLPVHYNFRLMQYLTPTHPLFISAFIIYAAVGMLTAIIGGPERNTRFHKAIIEAFSDLKDMTWLHALGTVVKNLLWPFKAYGIFIGFMLGVLTWPIFIPLSLVVCFIYCLPVVFLTCRIVYHVFTGTEEIFKKVQFESTVKKFEAEQLIKKLKDRHEMRRQTRESCYCGANTRRLLANIFMSFIILATMYSAMLMVAEVAGYLAEVACFTMMGLIVNASKVLRYGTLIFLVVIYSYDTYNNVNKRYLKLNKALFSEIQRRIKDLEEYTSLPSNLQENRGFKSCENSEQADYEEEDNICKKRNLYCWDINDLILFVDQDDTPRIPKKLFYEVCEVRVAGSPGPVYRSLLAATGKFLIIILFLVFVFIVVMSFGDSYKISSTNQTLATLAGGFMPFIFTNLLKPAVPQVETGLVSFRSKLEEIIKNYHQAWPMYDFIFDVGEKPLESESESESEHPDAQGELNNDLTQSTMTNPDGIIRTMSYPGCETQKPTYNPTAKDKNGGQCVNKTKKDKKENDKEKKDKDKDKKDKEKSSLSQPQPDTKKLMVEIKQTIEEMDLEDATPGSEVDIIIYVSESDHEWLMSSSNDSIPSFLREYIMKMEEQSALNGLFYGRERDTKV